LGTVRALIEGRDGQILCPGDLTLGRQIVVFRGACRWTGKQFFVPVGSQQPFRLLHYGWVSNVEAARELYLLGYRSLDGIEYQVVLGEHFALDRILFDITFPNLRHRPFAGQTRTERPTLVGA
jgi:hypothetical protein